MAQNRERMADFARHIHADAPRIKPSDTPSRSVRESLEGFAIASGMMTSLVGRATSTDLIGIYLVGDKDASAAARMIRTIEKRMSNGAGPLSDPDPVPPAWSAPEPPVGPPTRPGMGFTREERETIRDIADNALRSVLTTSLDTFGEALKQDTIDRIGRAEMRLTDTLADHTGKLVDTLKQEAATAVQDALKALTPTVLVLKTPNEPTGVNLGLVHKMTPTVIQYLDAGWNVYLHGPAGSGKTTMGQKCADAFGLEFYFCGKLDSEYGLLGFLDSQSRCVRTAFREAYEHGGLFLFDEMDRSDPSAVVAMNAALANGVCAFPDGIVKRHENCKIMGAGNTVMGGASALYQAAMQQDGSSIDRFAFLFFDYDEELERALSTDAKWVAYVQATRKAVADRGLSHLVTPRATIEGCKGLARGFPWDAMANAWVFKGLDSATVEQLKQAVKGAY